MSLDLNTLKGHLENEWTLCSFKTTNGLPGALSALVDYCLENEKMGSIDTFWFINSHDDRGANTVALSLGGPTTEANFRLMQAAPDLLNYATAAQKLLQKVAQVAATPSDDTWETVLEEVQDFIDTPNPEVPHGR